MQHPKGILIERCKQLGLGKPSFSTHNTGPEHEPLFESVVEVRGEVYGEGEGSTKRDAERRASEEALAALEDAQRARKGGPANGHPEPATRTADDADDYIDDGDGDNYEGERYDPDTPFSGPWPIFPEVLAASLSVAHARVNPTLTGPTAIEEVQALALVLYKGTLENLGEVAELDEDALEPPAS